MISIMNAPSHTKYFGLPLGVSLVLQRGERALFDDVNMKFQFFEVDGERQYEERVVLTRGIDESSDASEQSSEIADGIGVCPGGFDLTQSHGRNRIAFSVRGADDFSFRIGYDESHGPIRNTYDRDYVAQQLGLQCLERVYWKMNAALIHSACVAKHDKAILLVGRGGSRKTSLAMELARRHGFDILGDDRTLIRDNNAYPFVLSPGMLSFELQKMRNEDVGFRGKAGYILGRPWHWDSIPLRRDEKVQIDTIVCLQRTDGWHSDVEEQIGIDALATKLHLNNELEEFECTRDVGIDDSPIWRAFSIYAAYFPDSAESKFRKMRVHKACFNAKNTGIIQFDVSAKNIEVAGRRIADLLN